MIKKEAPTGVPEGGVNHNEGLCLAFRALANLLEAKGDCHAGNKHWRAVWTWVSRFYCYINSEFYAGGNSMFAARASNKVAGILEAYPNVVKEGKELKAVKGIGKGSMDKVTSLQAIILVGWSMLLSGMQHLLCCLLSCVTFLPYTIPPATQLRSLHNLPHRAACVT